MSDLIPKDMDLPLVGEMARPRNLHLWAKTLFEDEFNDKLQNEARGEKGKPSGHDALDALLALREPLTPVLDVGCGSGEREADYYLDPNPREGGQKVRKGWMEFMPFNDRTLGRIICWGTWCFLRSSIEALMESNRVLRVGGDLIFDVVLSTTMPLAQTVEKYSFVRHVELHGFRLVAYKHFGAKFHQRLALVLEKVRDWDPAYFRMLQATTRPLNYLEERDWFVWGERPI